MPLVLVVEPDDSLRGVLCQCLAKHGHRVLPAASAAEAEGLARGRSVDLLLTGATLPDSTGPAQAVLLRAEQPGPRVLYTSAGGDVGLAPLLVKPFGSRELLGKVRDVLSTTS